MNTDRINKAGSRMTFTAKDILTVPNLLSFFRIVLIPVFLILQARGETLYAAIVVAVSMLTDMLDGRIARKYNQTSKLGEKLDPVADKLFQAAIALSLLRQYEGALFLVAVFAIKELTTLIITLVLLGKGERLGGAKWFGKVSTAVFFIGTLLLVAFPNMAAPLSTALFIIICFALLLSFILYLVEYVRLLKKHTRS